MCLHSGCQSCWSRQVQNYKNVMVMYCFNKADTDIEMVT